MGKNYRESEHNVWYLLLNQLMAGYTCGCLVTPFPPLVHATATRSNFSPIAAID